MTIRPISKELQEKAINELNEDPERITEDLAYIKKWLSKQPHITARTDDQFLIAFLRGCKYSLERTKEKLDMYYTFKSIIPELYENRDPLDPDIQKILSLGVMVPLPKLAHASAPRHNFMRSSLLDQHKINLANFFKVGFMIQDILMVEDDNFVIAGLISIQDISNTSKSFALSMSPSLIKKTMTCYQHGYPVRIKNSHVFNNSAVFKIIHNLVDPFLTEKLKRRIRMHSSLEGLYQHVPKEIFPEEYGGEGGKLEDITAHWKAKVESYREWFLEDEKYKTDEKRRPGKPKTSESVFGLDGSFRKLTVD